MKKLTSIILYMGLALLILFLASCDDGSGITAPDGEEMQSLAKAEYNILEYEDGVMADLQEASMDSPMGWSDGMDARMHDGTGDWHHRHGKRRHALKGILRQLELTEEQHEAVKALTDAHKEFVTDARERLMAEVGDIIEAANAERELIKQQVENGDITREEAKELLKTLNEETRALIDANPVAVAIKEELCAAKVELLSDIGLLLDADQLLIWNDFVDNLEGPCFD